MSTHRTRFLVAILALACGGQTTEPTKNAVADVSVFPNSMSLTVAQTARLAAFATDRSGNAMDATTATWASSAPGVVLVTPSGNVTGISAGTATITASIGGHQGSAVVTVISNTLNVEVENQLIYPVTVSSGGVTLGTVSAQTTRQLSMTGTSPDAPVSWDLVRPTVSGRPIGDPMAGTFTTSGGTTGARHLVINNLIGTDYYFAPIIHNLTAADLLMVINYQLTSENRCNCVVAIGKTNVAIGYYRLYSNSNVTAFRGTSNYTGPYYYFYNFGLAVPVGSGVREFTYNIAP